MKQNIKKSNQALRERERERESRYIQQQIEFVGPNIILSLTYILDTPNSKRKPHSLNAIKAIQCK